MAVAGPAQPDKLSSKIRSFEASSKFSIQFLRKPNEFSLHEVCQKKRYKSQGAASTEGVAPSPFSARDAKNEINQALF